jgi:flagellar biosynthetic protein FliR
MRVGLIVLLAFTLAPLVPAPTDLTMGGLAFAVLREMLIGLALSVGLQVLIAAADMAGQLFGFQMGLSYGAIVDPQSGVRNGVLASLYTNVVVLLALLTGLHREVLRAVAASYAALPIGLGHVDGGLVVLLATELLLAFMARVAPSFNVIVLGAPARIVVGLLVAAATLATLPAIVSRYGPATLDLALETAKAFR